MRSLVSVLTIVVLAWFPHAAYSQTILKGCCVAFALDDSTSLTDDQFSLTTNFTAEIVDSFDEYAQVNGQTAAVIKFATIVRDVFRLSTHNNKADALIDILDLILDGGITNTHLAIDELSKLLDECNKDYNKAGIIITDGNSDDQGLTEIAANKFKDKGYLLFVVGIGTSINDDDLEKLTSQPQFYYPVADFKNLKNITITLTNQLCEEVVPPTTPIVPSNACLECEFINGLYLFSNKRYCYVFNQCLNWKQAVPFIRPCPFGQFYDQVAATCRLARSIKCPHDPCKDPSVASYPNHLVCSSYFVCEGRKTVDEKCCDEGERFVQGSGCVQDGTCTDPCRPKPQNQLCVLRAHSDITKYEENTHGNVWVVRNCAPATRFVAADCRCSDRALLKPDPDCTHELYLPFDKNVRDYMDRRHVTNSRPKTVIRAVTGAVSRAALFRGASRLIVKSYDNAWFGNKLVVKTRFLETARTSTGMEAIFGNGDCNRDESVGVKYDRATNSVIGKIITYSGGKEKVTMVTVAPVSAGAWKEVEYKYDGKYFRLTVDGSFVEKKVNGNIATRQSALQIGWCCTNYGYFTGYQDEFYVFPCIP